MNKFLRFIGIILLFLMLLLIILGVYSSSDVQITQAHQSRAPLLSIWQYMTDAEKFPDWISQLPVEYCEKDTNGQINCYEAINSKSVLFTIIKSEESKSFQLFLNKNRDNPCIKNYSMNIFLKSLRDGTTEINYEINYQLNNYAARIINKLYFEGHQKSLLDKNLELVHKYFEKV